MIEGREKRTRWTRAVCLFLLFALVTITASFAGCRCDNGSAAGMDAGAQPTMPTGMLSPAPSAAADADAVLTGPPRLQAFTTRPPTGDWVTIRVDGDVAPVRYVTVDTMTLLHEPFARTMPGFDLFVPRLFEGSALPTLRSELGAFKQEWVAVGSALGAKTKWGKASMLVAAIKSDDEWLAIRSALATTIDAILAVVDHVEKNNRRLLVQGS